MTQEEIQKLIEENSVGQTYYREVGEKRMPFCDEVSIESAARDIYAALQQPIPQDINKWIEDEAEKLTKLADPDAYNYPNSAVDKIKVMYWKSGAQSLLPQLQSQQEEIKQQKEKAEQADKYIQELRLDLHAAGKKFEQQKSQIDMFTKTLVEYAEQIVKQEAERKEQAAEIKSLKASREELREWNFSLVRDNESLKQENERLEKEETYWCENQKEWRDNNSYWKQRCEAAEENIAAYSDWHGAVIENGNSAMPVEFERWEKAFKHWQTLKQQTHG